jgi:hypothetical protein
VSSGQGSSSCALDEIAEEGAEEAAKRYFVTSHVAAKAVHLWQLRQRVVMAVQKAQADVLLHRLHYALPDWEDAQGGRDAQDKLHEAA